MIVDRQPPSAIEAEQGVIGCILWAPNESMNECEAVIRDGDEFFYDLRCRVIYGAMVNMRAEMEPIDLITLQQRLRDDQMLDQIGGVVYLSSLQDAVPSAANLKYYLDIVEEKAVLRKGIRLCTNFTGRAYENEGEADTLIDELERDVMGIRKIKSSQRTFKQMLVGATQQIEDRFNLQDKVGGISTGLPDLDRKTDGMHEGELIVVAAFPGVGKSALVGGIADYVAVELGMPVGIFSLEMLGEQYAKRMIASRARVNLRGQLSEVDFVKMASANARLAKAPIHIEDNSDITIGQLRATARRLHQLHSIKLWIVDYIQLMGSMGIRDGNREQEVAAISDGLKKMAKELRAPVLALSQLNDDGKLRESRKIGQDADCVWKLLRKDESGPNPISEFVNLFIEKQREGERGVTVPLLFLKQYTRFECPSPVSDADVPVEKKPPTKRKW